MGFQFQRLWLGSVAIALSAIATGGLTAKPAIAQTAAPLARPTDATLIAAAKAEGAVTFYGTSSIASLNSDVQGFQKAYGITATYQQLTSGPLTTRVDQEAKAGAISVDIIMDADPAAMSGWASQGFLAKLPDVNYPKMGDFMAAIQVVYQGLLYNTQTVTAADLPKSWGDVLLPRFTDKTVIGSARIGTGFATLYYALLHDPKYGEAFFTKLAAQHPRVVQNDPLVGQSVASGEDDIGFTGLPFDVSNIRKSSPGAPIDYVYLDVVTVAPTYLGINVKAQHPNAARLFAEWMMSSDGQVAHNGDGRASSALGNLPGTLRAPDPATVRMDATGAKVTAEYPAIIAMFDRLFK